MSMHLRVNIASVLRRRSLCDLILGVMCSASGLLWDLVKRSHRSQEKFGLGSKMAALSITCPAFTLYQRKSCLHLQCSPVLFISAPQINIAKPIAATLILSPLSLVISASHHSQNTFTSSPPPLPCLSLPSACGYCFSSLHHSCFLHCSVSIKNAASFMNSSK